jgi:hypothetical protein
MSYRPICDTWILGRSKVKYYGAYPEGFLSRARVLLGVCLADSVLHVCSGQVRKYRWEGLGPHDETLDVRPELKPDYVQDVTSPQHLPAGFDAMLADPPYTDADATQYGTAECPTVHYLMRKMLEGLRPGQRAGILHYEWPACPPFAREVAVVGVTTGRRQRLRQYTVMEVIR